MGPTYHVLIVEDVSTDAELNEREVRQVLPSCVFERVETEDAFLKALNDFLPDIIISDYKMPTFDGMTALKLTLERTPLTPFIVVTGSMNEDTAVDCMKAGAANYVIKQHLKRLGPAVLHAFEEKKVRIERLQAQEMLRENETRLNLALHSAGMGVWNWDVATNKRYFDDQTCHLLGIDTPTFTGSAEEFFAAIHPEDRDKVKAALDRVIAEGAAYEPEYRVVWPDGSVHYIASRGTLMRDDEGRASRLNGILWDITEHMKAEEEMRVLTTAVEYAADWIVITDNEGTIEYVNKAVENISGYAKEELVGRKPNVFKSGAHDEEHYRKLWETILSGSAFSGLLINRRKTGELFELHLTITPLKDPQNKIVHFVGTAKDVTVQKLLEERLDYTAYYDALTGLPNKALFTDRLYQAIKDAEQQGTSVAVVTIDIDRFTMLNDTLGYEAGDELLRKFGGRLSLTLGKECTVARLDADKFGTILVNIEHSEDVIMALEKMRNAFKRPFRFGTEEIVLTASMGISIFPIDGKKPETLMKNTDVALSKAKAGGMNSYQFFTGEMNVKTSEFVRLQRLLSSALQRDEYVMYYQPYFDISTQRMIGMEALLRWKSPEFGLVSPGMFIPILEETGMIVDVGVWIMKAVCSQIRDWMDKGYASDIVPVYSNLSLVQLRQKGLADEIETIIGKTGIYPHLLGIEITESTFMGTEPTTIEFLTRLKRLGISVNVDDFGTGYSSLSTLKRLPIDNLKIDISFVRDITDSPDDAAIVSTIISMAHNLNLKTIAEGVETEEQCKILRLLRCDMAQGYHFSKPLPAEEVEILIKRRVV